MLKQSFLRNQRSDRFRLKHAVQICLLCTIGIWYIYPATDSDANTAVYEETSPGMFESMQGPPAMWRFGRKDLREKFMEVVDDEGHEETENKFHRLQASGGGDDEIDGQDQFLAEEWRDEDDENSFDLEDDEFEEQHEETEEKRNELDEDAGSLDSQDHGGFDRTSQVGHEERYKGDDAASAVVQNAHTVNSRVAKDVKDQKLMGSAEKRQSELENQSEKVNVDRTDSTPKNWSKAEKSENLDSSIKRRAESQVVTVNGSQDQSKEYVKTTGHEQLHPNAIHPSRTSDLDMQKSYGQLETHGDAEANAMVGKDSASETMEDDDTDESGGDDEDDINDEDESLADSMEYSSDDSYL